MPKENKDFLGLLNKFYEHGLLKEVYRSESAIVCNAFNQYYIAFSLEVVQNCTKDFPGVIMLRSSGLLEIVRNDNFVNEYYGYLTQKQKTKLSMLLNADSFGQLLKKKEEYAQQPPRDRLNLEFEREVMEKGKNAIKGWRWHKYFLPLLFENEDVSTDLPTRTIKENKAFLELLTKFYENGLLKEVYRSQNVIVCNVLNQFYFVFDLEILQDLTENFPGFLMNSHGLRKIVEDNDYVNTYYGLLSDEAKSDAMRLLNENAFERLLKKKEDYLQRAVPDNMDLDFERELLIKGPETLKQEKTTPKRRSFGFLKNNN